MEVKRREKLRTDNNKKQHERKELGMRVWKEIVMTERKKIKTENLKKS